MPDEQHEYDLAISFAAEDRPLAKNIADSVKARGYEVFFDEYEKAKLWGTDLTDYLGRVYGEWSRFCLMIISAYYVAKPWTNHERQFALSRALRERTAYVLPLRIDDTKLPGLPTTIGYLDLRNCPVPEVCELICQKLGKPATIIRTRITQQIYPQAPIRDVLSACYRRAIFTRYHAQLNHESMFKSMAECRSQLQQLTPYVEPEEQQRLVAGIIAELDLIERVNERNFTWVGLGTMGTIDGAKLRINHALSQLAQNAGVSFVMPHSVTEELFFTDAEANSPPAGQETREGWVYGGGGFKG